ncbi:MAG: hypothetical protein ACLPPF_07725 [Rhodomicrobium sp.]
MRLRAVILCLLALFPQACAKRDPAIESLIGSEPQRLSFGAPPEVLHSFVEKMKYCWFSGASPALSGYRYETGERPAGDGGSSDGYQNVMIYAAGGNAEVFEVQFHKYNDNTLIVTRNLSLSPDLLTKVKRDIQLWVLSSPDCSA